MDIKKRILVIDDEQPVRSLLQRYLGAQGYDVIAVESGKDGIEKVCEEELDAVICDIKMPDMNGIDVLNQIKKIKPDLEVIISTGFGSMDVAVESLRAGAFDFLNKPFSLDQMLYTIQKAISSHESKRMIKDLNDGLKDAYNAAKEAYNATLDAQNQLAEANKSLENKVEERTKELSASEKKFRNIIDDSFDPIITLNQQGEIVTWNKGAELAFGYKEADVAGKSIYEIVITADNSCMTELREKGYVRNYIVKCNTARNEQIYVNITASTLDSGEISVIMRDITQEKKIDQMKSDFVSNVSHELRTPLTSIKGAIELVLGGSEGPVTDMQKELLDIVRNNALRLIKLIGDLLDLSKIEAGKIEMEIKPWDMRSIIKDTMNEMHPLTDKKSISLEFKEKSSIPMIFCDKDRIKQVLVNLIGNAVKFTPQNGSIVVSADDTGGEVTIAVTDSGMGISKENCKKLFERFQQIDSSSTRAQGGTGLGLAIAKSIVTTHKGRIWVESDPGKGSTFAFSLPKAKDEQIKQSVEGAEKEIAAALVRQKAAEKSAFSVKRILVVDDDQDVARVIQGHLAKDGYEVAVVNSGLEAVKKAVEFKPHLITLDILMPNLDGYSVAELLKQNPRTKDIPIVVISVVYEKERGYKLGVADYITKPFEPEQLFESIRRIETQIGSDMLKKKILIVDDDPDIMALLSVSVREKNYAVLNAYDGLQAVAMAKKEKPDMIILDLMLPEMDGFAVIEALKDDPETKDIPIVVATARTIDERAKAIKLGVKQYLVKPFTLRTLMKELNEIFEKENN